MILTIKIILIILMLVGIAMAFYGAYEIYGTMSLVKISTGMAKAKFHDYHREYHESTSMISRPDGSLRSERFLSVAAYPEFTYRSEDGTVRTVRERKVHVVEIYKPGEEVDILLFPHFEPRLAGFYSLYMRDLLILIIGLGLFLLPFAFLKLALPSMQTPENADIVNPAENNFNRILNYKIGPVSVRFILIGFIGFMGSMLLIALIAGLRPYLAQMRFGAGGRLIEAFEKKSFDSAREMIAKGSGIHATNEFNQNPLLLALETGQTDLARMLIEAGADVNIKSKMYMTPLRVATQSGDLEMVKLLLSKGASPDAPQDEIPPFAYALVKKNYEIARVLIEGGTDLHKRYISGDLMYTVGDMAMLAKDQEMIELIRRMNGSFTQ